jgi:hypothetical protein
MITDLHWTSYLSALLTPIVAVLGSFIAYRQWRLAQNKLKLELFDRRLSIHKAASDFLVSIATSGTIINEEFYKFMASTSETRWLISESAAKYFREDIFDKVLEFQRIDGELDDMPACETRTIAVNAKAEIRKWLLAQHKVVDEKFSKYLQLQH